MNIDRKKQFENVEGLLTWYDEIMSNYEAAFWIHYHMLNRDIEVWVEMVRENSEIPRVTYFVNTEYMSMVFCELLIAVETLFKAEITRCGINPRASGHKIIKLMDQLKLIGEDRGKQISQKFEGCRDIFAKTDDINAFANMRYIEYDHTMLNDDSALEIRKVVMILDEVYSEFYSNFDIEKLLYLGMMASVEYSNYSDDEIRRLEDLGLLDSIS